MSREGFIKAVEEDKVPNDTCLTLLLNGVEVLLSRVGGRVFATSARCTHKGCSLGEGWLDDGHLVCGCHLSKFDVKSGKVVEGPAEQDLLVFESYIDEGFIWIRL